MSVTLYKEGIQTVGRNCTECENGSVFTNRKYKFLGLVYDYSIDECEMDNCDYKYQYQQDRRDYILNKILK